MSRDWKPGDVAVAGTASEFVGMNDNGHWLWVLTGLVCIAQPPRNLRPVAAIDPADREQIDRLRDLLPIDWNLYQPDDPDLGQEASDAIQAALREFADPKPPKPDEPLGLGAVVEAGCGCDLAPHLFVRDPAARDFNLSPGARNVKTGDEVPWVSTCGHHEYEGLTNVGVLSEGVTP